MALSKFRTCPWLVSGRMPDPPEAKLTPLMNSAEGCKNGGITGNSAYSAAYQWDKFGKFNKGKC